jgi:hypothetical protein
MSESEKDIKPDTEVELVEPNYPKRKPTLKYRKWLKEYLRLGDATKAASIAYPSASKASWSDIGYENLKKTDYQELLEMAGVSDAKLLQTLNEGLEATQVTKLGEMKDHSTRHKYLETGLKLKKRLTDQKESTATNLIGLSIVVQK